MGRRSHEATAALRGQVEAMAGYGIPETDIACALDIDPKTLRKHYRRELDKGHIKANARVAENLYRKATGDGREAVTAAIFWLKTRARWKETSVHEVEGVTLNVVTGISRQEDRNRQSGGIIDHQASPRVNGYLPAPSHGRD
jgi:hypothetical protein